MDLQALKKRIYEEQKIATLLQALDCEHVHDEQGGNLTVCQLPPKFNSDNRRSVQIRNNESLWGHIRSRGVSGDIYAIVGYILHDISDFDCVKDKIYEIKKWICATLSYEEDVWNGSTIKKDWNSWLRPIQKQRPRDVYELENQVLDESIMHQYIPFGHMEWVKEGITLHTQMQFGVAYDFDSERIVYPVHNKHGQLIGVKGRYVGADPYVHENFKYLAMEPYSKSVELYNLHRAMPHIQQRNETIVVESAKSCMRLTQWGYPHCVSIEGKVISQTQIKLLKQLRTPLIFAWDKDMGMAEIEKQLQSFKSRIIYCIYDDHNLLSGKDSPTDKGMTTWEKLYLNNRKNIDTTQGR